MSKKHRKHGSQIIQTAPQSSGISHEAEYRIIKFDLVKVVILNLVYLAIILGLYYGNQKSGFLDHWFAKILHF
jgi:hypothetical protein